MLKDVQNTVTELKEGTWRLRSVLISLKDAKIPNKERLPVILKNEVKRLLLLSQKLTIETLQLSPDVNGATSLKKLYFLLASIVGEDLEDWRSIPENDS